MKNPISISALIIIGIVNTVLVVFGLIYWNYQKVAIGEFHTNSREYLSELLTNEHNKQIEALIDLLSLNLTLLSESLESSNLDSSHPLIEASLKNIEELQGVEVESSSGLWFFYKKKTV